MKDLTTPDPRVKPRILVVDDSREALEMICEILEEKGYEATGFDRADKALSNAQTEGTDLILIDAMMPGIDGYQACERFRKLKSLDHVPIIFVSGIDEPFEKVKAFRVGAVDYLTKPFHADEIDARITTHLRLSKIQGQANAKASQLETLVEKKDQEISDSQMALIFALAKLSESRDYETGQHMERIQNFCRILSMALRDRLGYDQIDDQFLQDIVCTSPLHDIGKVGIEDSILLKPGKLTEEEFTIMKGHSTIGAETLQKIFREYPSHEYLEMGIQIARSHHEKWDGSGYPDGLSGDNIPLPARIMALADVYDALRARRPYKDPFSHEKAAKIIRNDSGTHFDPAIVKAFLIQGDVFAATWDRVSEANSEETPAK